jgi:D-alanine-D-alanine ligase
MSVEAYGPVERPAVTRRRTVAVLFGGRSLEHDVSVVSGLQILHALGPDTCEVVPVYVDHATRWWTGQSLWHRDAYSGGGPDRSTLTEVSLSPGFGSSTLVPVGGDALGSVAGFLTRRRAVHVDVFLPILHGTFGEDGCLQGLLELGGCAYVGSGVLASATGMNKRVTKILAAQAGVPVVPWLTCERSALDRDPGWMHQLPAKVARHFGWPAIVKPCSLGSSAGVSVVASPDELVAGVLRVFEYDTEALIEPFIKNRLEINVAVAGLDRPVASITEMPVTHQESPLTFGEKYKQQGRKTVGSSEGMAGALRVLDPEQLPEATRAKAQQLASTVFAALGCEGIARADFLIDIDTNELYFNEINTLPGSLAFYLWSAAPHYWTITELLERLMDRAERVRAVRLGLRPSPPPELRLLS